MFCFDCFFFSFSKRGWALRSVGAQLDLNVGLHVTAFVIVFVCVYYTVCIVWLCVLSQRLTLIKPQLWPKLQVRRNRREGEKREREQLLFTYPVLTVLQIKNTIHWAILSSLSRIFSFLDVVSLCRCAQVSKVCLSVCTRSTVYLYIHVCMCVHPSIAIVYGWQYFLEFLVRL